MVVSPKVVFVDLEGTRRALSGPPPRTFAAVKILSYRHALVSRQIGRASQIGTLYTLRAGDSARRLPDSDEVVKTYTLVKILPFAEVEATFPA
jgi:hypothetical protein